MSDRCNFSHWLALEGLRATPVRPDIEVTTHGEPPEASLARILRRLLDLRHISPEPAAPAEPASESPVPPQLSRRCAR